MSDAPRPLPPVSPYLAVSDAVGAIDFYRRAFGAAGGWTPHLIAEHALPALKDALQPLGRSGEVFSWDPV